MASYYNYKGERTRKQGSLPEAVKSVLGDGPAITTLVSITTAEIRDFVKITDGENVLRRDQALPAAGGDQRQPHTGQNKKPEDPHCTNRREDGDDILTRTKFKLGWVVSDKETGNGDEELQMPRVRAHDQNLRWSRECVVCYGCGKTGHKAKNYPAGAWCVICEAGGTKGEELKHLAGTIKCRVSCAELKGANTLFR